MHALLWLLACAEKPDGPPPRASGPNTMDTAGGAVVEAPVEAERSVGALAVQVARLSSPITAGQRAVLTLEVSAPSDRFASTDIQWFVNQKPVGSDSLDLDPKWYRKGDRVHVTIEASDGVDVVTRDSNEVVVENSPPEFAMAADEFDRVDGFRMRARDPDGDPLTWRIEEGPPGLTVDTQGVLHYAGRKDAQGGTFNARIVVEDDDGASSVWPLRLDLTGGEQDKVRNRYTGDEVLKQ